MLGMIFAQIAPVIDGICVSGAALAVTVTAAADGAFRCETACGADRYSAYTVRGFALLLMQISEELLPQNRPRR